MTIKASGSLSMQEIGAEFGLGTNLGAYRGVQWWLDNGTTGYFNTGSISINEFYSKRGSWNTTTPTVFGWVESAQPSSASSWTPSVPANSPDGGLAFMFIMGGSGPPRTYSTPPGWNTLPYPQSGTASDDAYLFGIWRVISGSLTSPTITSNVSTTWLSTCIVINPNTYRTDFTIAQRTLRNTNIDGPSVTNPITENFLAIESNGIRVVSPYTGSQPSAPPGWTLSGRFGFTSGGLLVRNLSTSHRAFSNTNFADPPAVTYNNVNIAQMTIIVPGKLI